MGLLGIAATSAWPRTTQPSQDAAKIYLQAAKIIRDDDAKNIMSPAASDMSYPGFPPMTDAWLQMEKQDYGLHARVRQMVHDAASMTTAAWPEWKKSDPARVHYLNECRNLANEIADAALYQSLVLNDQPAAFSSARDLLHLAELLKNQPGENLVRLLVAVGIEALDVNRLMVMTSGATITEDASNARDLPLSTAKDWIATLLNHPDAQKELNQAMSNEPAGNTTNPILQPSLNRILETIRRIHAERDMAAMSLAAHVYRYEHGQWPSNLSDLASELPRVPIDPWGDGKQTLGYVLVKGGLPNGADRPLVFSRCRSRDGLFFRTDEPEYSFYVNSTARNVESPQSKEGGQFRDVARWTPPSARSAGPTTQPLQYY